MEQVILNPPYRPSSFARLGHLSYRYHVLVIAIWGALLLLSLALTPHLDSVFKGVGTVYEAGEASRAEQLLKQEHTCWLSRHPAACHPFLRTVRIKHGLRGFSAIPNQGSLRPLRR